MSVAFLVPERFPSKKLFSVQIVHIFRSSVITKFIMSPYMFRKGRAIAQAVSRWLPIAAARVRSEVRSCGICDGQSGTGAGFLRVLRFPLPILIPPTAPQSSSIIRGWYNRPTVADVPSQSHPTQRNFMVRPLGHLQRLNSCYQICRSSPYMLACPYKVVSGLKYTYVL
jgi:hypothetical protein